MPLAGACPPAMFPLPGAVGGPLAAPPPALPALLRAPRREHRVGVKSNGCSCSCTGSLSCMSFSAELSRLHRLPRRGPAATIPGRKPTDRPVERRWAESERPAATRGVQLGICRWNGVAWLGSTTPAQSGKLEVPSLALREPTNEGRSAWPVGSQSPSFAIVRMAELRG